MLGLYDAMLATARLILCAFAELQATIKGPRSATWLADAMADSNSDSLRANILRVMSYANKDPSGKRETRWSHQPPHQDPAWLALIIQSGSGLKSARADGGVLGTRVPADGLE